MALPFFMQVQENSSPGTAFRRRYIRSRRFLPVREPRRLQRYGTLHAVTARSTGPVYQKTWIYRESFTDVHARQLLFFGVSILGHAVTHQQVLSLSRTSQGKKPTSKNITHSVSLDLDRYGVLRHRLRDSSS
jgi:hypothetical protein